MRKVVKFPDASVVERQMKLLKGAKDISKWNGFVHNRLAVYNEIARGKAFLVHARSAQIYILPVQAASEILEGSNIKIVSASSKNFSGHDSDFKQILQSLREGRIALKITSHDKGQAVLISEQTLLNLMETKKSFALPESDLRTNFATVSANVDHAVDMGRSVEIKIGASGVTVVIHEKSDENVSERQDPSHRHHRLH